MSIIMTIVIKCLAAFVRALKYKFVADHALVLLYVSCNHELSCFCRHAVYHQQYLKVPKLFDIFPKYTYVQCSCFAGLEDTKYLDGDPASIRAKLRMTPTVQHANTPSEQCQHACAAWCAVCHVLQCLKQ